MLLTQDSRTAYIHILIKCHLFLKGFVTYSYELSYGAIFCNLKMCICLLHSFQATTLILTKFIVSVNFLTMCKRISEEICPFVYIA